MMVLPSGRPLSSPTSTPTLPLLGPRELDAPLAWHHGRPFSAAQFLAEAMALAPRLPASGEMLNLCSDRYDFALALAAAQLRGQLCLLPPNDLPDTLARLDEPGRHRYPQREVERVAPLLAPPASMPHIAADHLAACLLTSGSTGTPQPHAKTWGQLHANIGAAARRLAESLDRPSLAGLNLVTTVPAQHSYGFESSVMLALLGGAAFDTGRPFYPADIARALASVPRPRALVTTPFHLKTLLLAGVELPPVDLILSATAPLSPQLALQAEQVSGGVLIEIYGCTEAGQVATRRTVSTDQWTTFDGLAIHADGERYRVQGGHVAEPTELADVLELQDGQHFRLLGRANDLIRVAGKRSSLAHLNFHLNSLDGVLDGAFWLPDEVADGVVRPIAFVVAPALRAAAIVDALRTRLEPAFLPRRVIHVDALPRESTGKLTVATLRRFALTRLGKAGGPL